MKIRSNIIIPSLIVVSVCWICAIAIIYGYSKSLLLKGFEEQCLDKNRNFVSIITNDLLTGYYLRVSGQLEGFIKNSEAQSIIVYNNKYDVNEALYSSLSKDYFSDINEGKTILNQLIKQNKTSVFKYNEDDSRLIVITPIFFNQNNGDAFGYLLTFFSSKSVFYRLNSLLLFLVVVTGLSLLGQLFVLNKTALSISNSIKKLIESIKKSSKNKFLDRIIYTPKTLEFREMANEYNQMVDSIMRANKKIEEANMLKTTVKIARQVAHDIRSPLAALNMVTHDLKQLPEEERVIIRSAVQRIQDIANDLASKKDQSIDKTQDMKSQTKDQSPKEMKIKLLSSLVEQMVSEKRTEFRSRSGINIVSNLGAESYGLFANIHSREFKRILSNLINNSAEAMDGNGNITVSLSSSVYRLACGDNASDERRETSDVIAIAITDNGKGIPQDIIPKLMQKGVSFGKEGHKKSGSGLGLYHARETVESWGGNINIESQLGEGTKITITIPKQQAPDWFVPEITFTKDQYIFILDDDDSIHQVWQNRFNTAKIPKEKIHHFKSCESIINFYREKEFLLKKAKKLFLFDYELLGNEKTGLQIIDELNIKENAILVTSHYEEEYIRNECKRLGVKLLPKNLAGFVPISVIGCRLSVVVKEKNMDSGQRTMDNDQNDGRLSVVEKDEKTINDNRQPKTDQNCDAILIDDDYLVHTTWRLIAKQHGKTVKCYVDPEDFVNDSDDINKATPLYIDSNLGDGVKGEVLAKEFYEQGFTNIYLATGYPKDDFAKVPWIKDVVGKQPPFGNQ